MIRPENLKQTKPSQDKPNHSNKIVNVRKGEKGPSTIAWKTIKYE